MAARWISGDSSIDTIRRKYGRIAATISPVKVPVSMKVENFRAR